MKQATCPVANDYLVLKVQKGSVGKRLSIIAELGNYAAALDAATAAALADSSHEYQIAHVSDGISS